MCHLCRFPTPPVETRRGFFRQLAGAAVSAGLVGTGRAARAANAGDPPPAVASSGWGRILTPHPEWDFHNDREAQVVDFIREDRSLGANMRHGVADPRNLASLCQYPFLFSFDLTDIRDAREWANLREYIYRGGFLYLDNCVHVSPNITAYRTDHLTRLTRLLPASEWRRLSDDHPIYRTRYPIKPSQLPDDAHTPDDQLRALYGVFDDDRMVALVSMAHLFCGWPERPSYVEADKKQMVNIYAYARAH